MIIVGDGGGDGSLLRHHDLPQCGFARSWRTERAEYVGKRGRAALLPHNVGAIFSLRKPA
jgi:hypothetical protein